MKQDQKYALIKDPDEELAILHQKKIDLMASLKAQLDEHEAMKFLQKERKEQEREEMKRIWEQQEMEEIEKKALERERHAKLGLELIANQVEIVERRMKEKEMDKELDQRVKRNINFHFCLFTSSLVKKIAWPQDEFCYF